MSPPSFESFIPFRRDLKTPCLILCKSDHCGHCHDFAPHVKKAQNMLKKSCPVYVADAEKHAKIMNTFKVTGFPELFILTNARILKKYRGPRDASKIVEWTRSHM